MEQTSGKMKDFEKLKIEDAIESVVNMVVNGTFMSSSGVEHYAREVDINPNQNMVKITLSDDTIIELSIKMRY